MLVQSDAFPGAFRPRRLAGPPHVGQRLQLDAGDIQPFGVEPSHGNLPAIGSIDLVSYLTGGAPDWRIHHLSPMRPGLYRRCTNKLLGNQTPWISTGKPRSSVR